MRATACLLLAASLLAASPEPEWSRLSRAACNVDEFAALWPERDGRGVVIAILDTGVDMGVPGLDLMPDGSAKVIDAQDFSGEGDVELRPAVWDEARERIVLFGGSGEPQAYVPGATGEGERFVGVLEEKAFRYTRTPDVNDNGRKDDVFAILVAVPRDGEPFAYVDTDADRDWSDERPLRSYRVAQESFAFARTRPEAQLPTLTAALEIDARGRRVSVHFDGGGHGTHVAGIAAGWRINGEEGFDGIAPGARVISLKIGSARDGGASTTGAKKRAFSYAARFSREHGVPVVCNLSYGIGSEREGGSEIDRVVEEVCRENPNLVVCISGGNDGPGLSSIGTPAAAGPAITSAAVLAPDTARDVLGLIVPEPVVAPFSSRGGVLDKPDLATPGFAGSTVPLYNRRSDFWRGTSMASPYTAGLAARLVSGRPPTPAETVKRALMESAVPAPGYTPLDQGAGVPDLPRAAEALERAGAVRLEVETECPFLDEGKGPAAYWRTTHLPETQTFVVRPVFPPFGDAAQRRMFSRRYELKGTEPWCTTDQREIYLRGEQDAEVLVRYHAERLKEPGLHVADVLVLDEGRIAARLRSTLVVPLRGTLHERKGSADGWRPQRHFLAVPAGATAMRLSLESEGAVRGSVFRPSGSEVWSGSLRTDAEKGRPRAAFSIADDLEPGVWEVCVTSRDPDRVAPYELSVHFHGVAAEPARIESWAHRPGGAPRGEVAVTNLFDEPLHARLEGELSGHRRTLKRTLRAHEDRASIPLELAEGERGVRIAFSMRREEYERFTDIGVAVFDGKGEKVEERFLHDRRLDLRCEDLQGKGRIEILGGFTHPDDERAVELEITLDVLYAEPVPIRLTRNGSSEATLHPGVRTRLAFELQRTPPAPPSGTRHAGVLRVLDGADGEPAREIAVEIR